MSAPFVYTPQVNYRGSSPYLAPHYNQQYSPFIPELSLDASPYASPYTSPYRRAGSLPPSPNFRSSPLPPAFTPNNIAFPGSPEELQFPSNSPWPRERRLSWNEGNMLSANQNVAAWLQAPGYPHQRSRSDVGYNSFRPPVEQNFIWPPASPYSPYTQLPPAQPQYFLHPFLNAENRQSEFILDLSSPQFNPLRHVGNNQTVPITVDEFNQIATYPPIYNLHIVCDLIPHWPINLNYDPTRTPAAYSSGAPPIKLGDVLTAIWNAMQTPISQQHWGSLTRQQEHMVSRAYTKRCKARPPMQDILMNQGVKRVDFLQGKIWFKGLLMGGDGFDNMKMIIA